MDNHIIIIIKFCQYNIIINLLVMSLHLADGNKVTDFDSTLHPLRQ